MKQKTHMKIWGGFFLSLLTLVFANGLITTRAHADPNEPEEVLSARCAQGDATGCLDLGMKDTWGYGKGINEARGIAYFESGCDKGNARSCGFATYGHLYGRGANANVFKAIDYGRKACDGNDSYGCSMLGRAYKQSGPMQNLGRAFNLFKKSCDLREAFSIGDGCAMLGIAYSNGEGTLPSDYEAVSAFQRSCVYNDPLGCVWLGYSLENGKGFAVNLTGALASYEKACVAGSAEGCTKREQLNRRMQRAGTGTTGTGNSNGGGGLSVRGLAGRLGLPKAFGRSERGTQVAQAGSSTAAAAATSRATASSTSTPSSVATTTASSSNSAPGFLVCSALMPSTSKFFYNYPFAGTAAQSNEMVLAFTQYLRTRGYASDMHARAGSPPIPLTVDCRWSETQAAAIDVKTRLEAGATLQRMTTVPTSFEP
jgi:TPR repeat protein